MFNPRWQVKVIYRTEIGNIDVIHDVEDIEDMSRLIEAGPHWDTIVRMEVMRFGQNVDVGLTVERAAEL